MTTQQWDKHQQHVDDHIKWSASKQEIIDACQGMDVEPEVLEELKTKLSDGGKRYTKEELKSILVA